MLEEFDLAVGAVKEFLEKNKYAYGTRAAHLRCYKRLDAYLTERGEMYIRHTAGEWFGYACKGLNDGDRKVFRRALEKLDAAYHLRDIGGTSAKSGMRQTYRCLAPWCKALLEDFVAEMSAAFGPDCTQAAKISAARFLSAMTGAGIHGPEDISHRMAVDHCRDGEHTSKPAAGADKGHVRRFLRHLSEKGMVRVSIHMALDQSVFPRLVFIDSLNSEVRGRFLTAAEDADMSAESHHELAAMMHSIVIRNKYAETAQQTFRAAYKELFVFLEANSLGYSAGVALVWANLMSRYTVQWMSFRRAVMLFEQFRKSGRIDPGIIYRYQPDRASLLPEWCRSDYEGYIRLKEKAGVAESTLSMCRNSCLRFMEYLCAVGMKSWGQVTPELLKEFHRQDPHSTPEGKNAYSSRIRNFIEYLGEIRRVPPTVLPAVPSESSRRVSIVKVLREADIEGIYRYRDSAGSAVELRDAAMILMGLRMGMRDSDVTKIRFCDISWGQRAISVQQKKTDAFIKLPMPVEVGNAIYRYITQARPGSDSEFVFINHKVPYDRLHRSVCRGALLRALPGKATGFHATRRTFASRMPANNVEAERIAETLGHLDNSSVMMYLSTDGDKMRLCAIPLAEIPVKGGAPS
jgi:integrase